MSIHYSAVEHLDKTIGLAEKGDYDSLRYAVLELRYGIECLVYELLPDYREELPDEVLEAWRPGEILQAIVECNPKLPHSVSLAMGIERPDGSRSEAVHMGTQTGLTPEALQEDYARLGSFLHAKKPDGQPHDLEKLRRSVLKVIESLERYRGDSMRMNFAARHDFICSACNRKVLRRVEALDINPYVRCPNKNCRAIHERIRGESGEYLFRILRAPFTCPQCSTDTFFDRHQLGEGVKIKCRKCSTEFVLRLAVLTLKQDQERTEGEAK